MWLGYGEEMLADEGKAVASLAAKQGVTVIWEQFEAMPHCFPMIFDQLPASRKYNKDWADFCGTIASDTVGEGGAKLETKGIWFAVKTCKETNVNVMSLAVCSQEEVEERMRRTKEASMKGDEGEAKILPKL